MRFTEHFTLPRRLVLHPAWEAEIKFLVKKYQIATTDSQRDDVLETLLVWGSRWDAITRSCCYYPEFEKLVGQDFPILWG